MSSYSPTGLAGLFCEYAQISLANLVNNTAFGRDRFQMIGALSLLLDSGFNNGGSQPDIRDMMGNRTTALAGKDKKVVVRYQKPICTDFADEDCADDLCTPGTPEIQRDVEQILDIPECYHKFSLTITDAETRELCQSTEQYVGNWLARRFAFEHQKLNLKIVQDLIANIGDFADENGDPVALNPKPICILNSDGTINDDGMAQVSDDRMYAGLSGLPYFLGSGKMKTYMRKIQLACCNAAGQNTSNADNLEDFRWWQDPKVGQEVGDPDQFLSLERGFVKLLTYNKNVGEYNDGTGFRIWSRRTFTDQLGLVWDWYIKTDDCAEDLTYFHTFKLRACVWTIPTDATCNINGITMYKAACCEGAACVPIVPTPPLP